MSRKVIEFYSDTCVPCKTVGGLLQGLRKEEDFILEFVNAKTNEEMRSKYDIMSVPTVVVLEDGNEIKRLSGLVTKEQLLEAIRKG